MRPRRDPKRSLRPSAVALLGALACACSSTKEWEEKPGTLTLYAEPLPPTAGAMLALGVVGDNVGPVDVFQGTTRIASFANVDVSKRYDVHVRAVSAEVPRAITVAYDRRTIEVTAASFPSAPAPIDADAGGPAPDDGERCPGVEDLTDNACTPASDAGALAVRVHNASANPLSVYELSPGVVDPNQCQPSLVTLIAAGAEGRFTRPPGTVLRIVDDRTALPVRIVRLPAIDSCALRIPKDG